MIRFLSTPSARRATGLPVLRRWSYKAFLSTPSARRATHSPQTLRSKSSISIHALREEGDGGVTQLSRAIGISIHALREEGDDTPSKMFSFSFSFLSTPSARRATTLLLRLFLIMAYFYPRPPRGGRPICPPYPKVEELFLSTPSARRATCAQLAFAGFQAISIHALREEGDSKNRDKISIFL